MNKFTKFLIASATAVAITASSLIAVNAQSAQPITSAELEAAVSWGYDNGLTKYSTVETFRPNDPFMREHGAKFYSEFAENVLCLEADTTKSCDFSDLSTADYTLVDHIVKSCQLGIFQGSNGQFGPKQSLLINQAETVVARAVVGMQDESMTPRWKKNHEVALEAGFAVVSGLYDVDTPSDRGQAMVMAYRARGNGCGATDDTTTDDLGSILEDLFGDDDDTTTTTTTTGGDTTGDDTTEYMCSDGTPLKTVGASCDDGNPATTNDRYVDECNCGGDLTTTTTTTTNTNTSGNGSVSCDATVTLNAASPAGSGQEIPGLATAVVAIYDVMAGSDDLLVDNFELQRIGLGSDNAVNYVAIYTLDGTRVSNGKSFNSDEEAYVSLNPKVTVPAGTTQSFVVVAEIGDSNLASNEEFAIRLNTFNSTCEVNLDAGEFEVAAVNAAMIEIDDDGSVQDVELGNSQAEVATFSIDNEDDSDVYITAITLRDDENNADDDLANFTLVSDNEVLATTAYANGRYVTFQLDTPFMIKDGDTEDFEVMADVIAGAGDQIAFYVDRAIDVSGFDETYGYGLNVDVSNYTAQQFTITAGELTFVEHPIPTDQTRADKDDVVLMEFHIDVESGQDLTLEDILFDVYSDTPTCLSTDIDNILENIELRDITNGGTYTLNTSAGTAGANCHVEAFDNDLGITLVEGNHTFQLTADIANTIPTADLGKEVYVELRPSGNDVEVIENMDDEQVTDIVPSFLDSEAIEFNISGVEVVRLPVSSRDVVNGARDLLLIDFEVETDDVSPITFDEITVAGAGACAANFNDAHISQVTLYRGAYPDGTAIDFEDLNGGSSLTFDDFDEVLVPTSSTQPMYITVDLVDDNANVGNCIGAEITSIDAEDDENDPVTVTNGGTSTINTVTIQEAGILKIESAINDVLVEDEKNVLAGTTSDYVAAFELDATNEAVFIEDFVLVAGGAGATDFVDTIDRVAIYEEGSSTPLYTETVNSTTVTFNNFDYVVPETGTKTLYVKVIANEIGFQELGKQSGPYNFTMVVNPSDAQGVESGDDMDAGTSTLTSGVSKDFYVVPVAISNVDFVNSAGSALKSTTLATDSNVAILRVTADTWANTDSGGGDLDLKIMTITLDESLGSATTVGSYEIYKADGNEVYVGAPSGGQIVFTVSGSTEDFVLEEGEVADFVVEAKGVTLGGPNSGDDSVRVQIDSFSAGAITFAADDTGIDGYAVITDPRLGIEFLNNNAVVD